MLWLMIMVFLNMLYLFLPKVFSMLGFYFASVKFLSDVFFRFSQYFLTLLQSLTGLT